MSRQFAIAAACAFAAGLASGCGEPGPHLVPVSGTVTLNGDQPLERAEVSFIPDPMNLEVTPGGDMTGPDGGFKPRYNARFGLAPGKYKVVISKKSEPPPELDLPEEMKVDRVQQQMMGVLKETLPAHYSDVTESEEFVEVKEDEPNIFEFDVKMAESS